jgi:hypothetical protein
MWVRFPPGIQQCSASILVLRVALLTEVIADIVRLPTTLGE